MINYSSLTEVHNLRVFHVVREDKRQYEVGEIISSPFKEKRDFSHWPEYKQKAEEALEEERIRNYPNYPSRENCMFAALDMKSALNWVRNKYLLGGEFYLYELEILNGKIINLDTDFFEEAGLIIGEKKILISGKYTLDECIKKYWEGKSFHDDVSLREILIYGTVKVISKEFKSYSKVTGEIK